MKWFFGALCLATIVSCNQLGVITGMNAQNKALNEAGSSGLDAYRAAGGRISGLGAFETNAGIARVTVKPGAGIAPERDIVWAPADPDLPIPGEEFWQKTESKSWHVSHTEASRYSRQSGKPLLIWFTDSAHSPLCRRLSSELFSKSNFEKWAKSRIVRLRVDSTLQGPQRYQDIGIRKQKFVEKLKRRYDVHGHPTVVVVSPTGAVIESYRGYKKGNSDYYWGRIKQAVLISEKEYGAWREKLEARGYRMWENRSGRKTLAKLYRFRPGKVTLIDPDGNRGTTSLNNLSDADQRWISLQKKRHENRQNR